ncbi:MAG TPA: anti-sigma factor domain-containing protein, partial [Clostridium sp.]|nr:anti-sigma factor domain-containing protein [Clostridium sp.]
MANLGIIVKIQEKSAIVVSEAGLFEMIKYREGMFVGQKVFYSEKDIISKKQKHKYFIPAIASVAAIFILLMSYFRFFYSDEIYAYIAVDINPSLELMINEDSIVIDAVAFNEDGEMILNNIKYKGRLLERVVYNIIKNSEEQGFILKSQEKEIVLISTAFEDKKQPVEKELFNDKLINNLKNEIDKELDDNIDIQFVEVPINKRRLASETEVSMGKYLIYEKVKEKGKDIPIDVLKSSSLNQLIKENDIDIHKLALGDNEDREEITATPKATHTQEEEVPADSATPTKAPAKTPEVEATPTKEPAKTPEVEATPTKEPTKTPEAEATPTKEPTKTPEAEATPTKEPTKTPEA